jgi:hypothetical protein
LVQPVDACEENDLYKWIIRLKFLFGARNYKGKGDKNIAKLVMEYIEIRKMNGEKVEALNNNEMYKKKFEPKVQRISDISHDFPTWLNMFYMKKLKNSYENMFVERCSKVIELSKD